MAGIYTIMEHNKLEHNGIIAIPEGLITGDVLSRYHRAGTLAGIAPGDFVNDPHFGFDYVPLAVVGSLEGPSVEMRRSIMHGLDSICQDSGIDAANLLADKELQERILDYEMVSGDVYVVRIGGDSYRELGLSPLGDRVVPYRGTQAYLVAPEDGDVKIQGREVVLNGVPQKTGDDLKFALGLKNPEWKEVLMAGRATLHRKSMRPFKTRGRFGTSYTNGPWIILKGSKFVEFLRDEARDYQV